MNISLNIYIIAIKNIFGYMYNKNDNKLANKMLELTNMYRINNNKQPLIYESRISKVAHEQAHYMCKKNQLTHESPKGKLKERLQNIGFKVITIGENIAQQENNDYKELAKLWMKSEPHRNNILGNFDYTDVATCRNGINRYWIQIFGKEINKETNKEEENEYSMKKFVKNQPEKTIKNMIGGAPSPSKNEENDFEIKNNTLKNIESCLRDENCSILPSMAILTESSIISLSQSSLSKVEINKNQIKTVEIEPVSTMTLHSIKSILKTIPTITETPPAITLYKTLTETREKVSLYTITSTNNLTLTETREKLSLFTVTNTKNLTFTELREKVSLFTVTNTKNLTITETREKLSLYTLTSTTKINVINTKTIEKLLSTTVTSVILSTVTMNNTVISTKEPMISIITKYNNKIKDTIINEIPEKTMIIQTSNPIKIVTIEKIVTITMPKISTRFYNKIQDNGNSSNNIINENDSGGSNKTIDDCVNINNRDIYNNENNKQIHNINIFKSLNENKNINDNYDNKDLNNNYDNKNNKSLKKINKNNNKITSNKNYNNKNLNKNKNKNKNNDNLNNFKNYIQKKIELDNDDELTDDEFNKKTKQKHKKIYNSEKKRYKNKNKQINNEFLELSNQISDEFLNSDNSNESIDILDNKSKRILIKELINIIGYFHKKSNGSITKNKEEQFYLLLKNILHDSNKSKEKIILEPKNNLNTIELSINRNIEKKQKDLDGLKYITQENHFNELGNLINPTNKLLYLPETVDKNIYLKNLEKTSNLINSPYSINYNSEKPFNTNYNNLNNLEINNSYLPTNQNLLSEPKEFIEDENTFLKKNYCLLSNTCNKNLDQFNCKDKSSNCNMINQLDDFWKNIDNKINVNNNNNTKNKNENENENEIMLT